MNSILKLVSPDKNYFPNWQDAMTTEWSRSKIIMGKLEEYGINAIRKNVFFFWSGGGSWN